MLRKALHFLLLSTQWGTRGFHSTWREGKSRAQLRFLTLTSQHVPEAYTETLVCESRECVRLLNSVPLLKRNLETAMVNCIMAKITLETNKILNQPATQERDSNTTPTFQITPSAYYAPLHFLCYLLILLKTKCNKTSKSQEVIYVEAYWSLYKNISICLNNHHCDVP